MQGPSSDHRNGGSPLLASRDAAELADRLEDPHCRAALRFLRRIVGVVELETLAAKTFASAGSPENSRVMNLLADDHLPELERLDVVGYDADADEVWYRQDNPHEVTLDRLLD